VEPWMSEKKWAATNEKWENLTEVKSGEAHSYSSMKNKPYGIEKTLKQLYNENK